MRCCFPRHIATFLGVAVLMFMGDRLGAATFEEFVAGYGLAGTNAEPMADPDGDGMPNIIEYLLAGQNPVAAGTQKDSVRLAWGTRATGTEMPCFDASVITEQPIEDYAEFVQWYPDKPNQIYYLGIKHRPRSGTSGYRLAPQYAWMGSEAQYWLSGPAAFSGRTAPDEGGWVTQWVLGAFDSAAPTRWALLRLKTEETPISQ